MAYEILPRPHPSIALVHMFSEIEEEDFRLGDALELDKGNPVYLLVDTTGTAITLPPNFMENVRSSALFDDNLAHVAVFTRSATVCAVVRVMCRLTGQTHKVSLHDSREAALNHLLALVGAESNAECRAASA